MANISKDKASDSKLKTVKSNKTVDKASANTSSTKSYNKKPVKKSTNRTKTTRKITKTSKKMKQKETGEIKEASIAKFMRKRTQLVGFDYGNFKHTQYAVEFADNALDAIEKFQWDAIVAYEDLRNHMERVTNEFEKFEYNVQKLSELVEKQVTNNKKPTKETITKLSNLYQLKPIIFQKILDVYNEYGDDIEEITPYITTKITISNFDEEYKKFSSEIDEINEKYGDILTEVYNLNKNPKFMFTMDEALSLENLKYIKSSDDQPEEIEIESLIFPDGNINFTSKKKLKGSREKKEEEAIRTLKDLAYDFLSPVREIINKEPMVIIKVQEEEAPEVLWEKGDRSDSLLYTFEIFDNGTGMTLPDFEKFGKYLASSKSQKLRQTRGSQGFGSPSAFSDSQNTTGKPIIVISKHSSDFEGICSEFYTTENNTKEYIVKPTEIEVFFLHGTYIKLSYLNKKYTRGYIDSYVEKAAMMNTHVTFIYIDPYNEEHIFPRKIDKFPNEPKFALPHPSSIKIGEFQDLLRSSKKLTVTAFLADSFVRMSNILAKSIVSEAEFEIEQKLKILSFDIGFISVMTSEEDKLLFIREEKRVFGRSTKPRLMKIIYEISDKDFKYSVWTQLEIYNQNLKKKESFEKKQRNVEKSLKKESNKKKLKEKKKEIKVLEKSIEQEVKSMGIVKANIKKLLLKAKFEIEIENNTIKEKMFSIVRDLVISKTKPSDLTQKQIEFLYMAFKDKKYTAPPTDTAIPVGEISLETAIIKRYNLKISNMIDFFGNPTESIQQIGDFEKKNLINKNLIKFNDSNLFIPNNNTDNFPFFEEGINNNVYSEMIFDFDLNHTMGDDFIAAHTRKPTSGKGLAFVVEAVMAYSPQIPFARKAASVISRYVNRTPKMRDNSDCALWMGIQSVHWKQYKVTDTFDNGIPKGNYVLYINCSGPYTHLMFKSQSKNALAEDDILLKEVKLCLEVIGRKLKNYMNKKEYRDQKKKKSDLIKQNIPAFTGALYQIAKFNPKFTHLEQKFLEEKVFETLQENLSPKKSLKKAIDPEIKPSDKEQHLPKPIVEKEESLKDYPEKIPEKQSKEITVPERTTIKSKETIKPDEAIKQEKKVTLQTTIEMYSLNEKGIMTALNDGKWYTLREIIKKMRISSLMDARFLRTKLKMMVKKGSVSAGKKTDKIVWKIK